MVALPAAAKAASDSGQMTPLFAMEDERIDLFPDIPTAVEKGVDFIWSSWKGVIGPKGTDEAMRTWLREAVENIATDEEFVKRLVAQMLPGIHEATPA
jgi:tripartite-type tricarboxylate transporter receptor subunit TctC